MWGSGAAPTSITAADNGTGGGNVYALAAVGSTNTTDRTRVAILIAPITVAATITTVTSRDAGGVATSTDHSVCFMEFSGLASATPYDTGAAFATAASSATSTSAGPTATLAQADELVISAFGGATGSASSAITAPTGFTQQGVENNSSSFIGMGAAWANVASTAAITAAWSHVNSPDRSHILATFKAAGGSPDVTLALTGQDVATAQGTINDTISRALTSGSITAAQGTAARATAYGLTGQDMTAAAGTVTVDSGSPDVTLALTGLDLTASQGGIGDDLTIGLAGQGVAASQGTITADTGSPDVTKALTGQALGLAQGDLTASGGDAPAGRNGGAEFTKGRGPVPTRSFTPILQRMLEARGRKVKPQGERRQVRAKTIEVEAADAILDGADEQAMRDAMARWLAQGIVLPAGADPLDLFLAQVLFRLQQRRIAEQQAEDMAVRAALERAARQENDAVMALLLA